MTTMRVQRTQCRIPSTRAQNRGLSRCSREKMRCCDNNNNNNNNNNNSSSSSSNSSNNTLLACDPGPPRGVGSWEMDTLFKKLCQRSPTMLLTNLMVSRTQEI